jgi:hypothetical protein
MRINNILTLGTREQNNIICFKYKKEKHYIIIYLILLYYNYKRLGYKVYTYLKLKK